MSVVVMPYVCKSLCINRHILIFSSNFFSQLGESADMEPMAMEYELQQAFDKYMFNLLSYIQRRSLYSSKIENPIGTSM